MVKNVFTEKFVTDATSIDFSYTLPIYELIRLVMRITLSHAEYMGLGHEIMEKGSNAFWIISKLKLIVNNPIVNEDKLTLKTWAHEPENVRCKRDFSIKKQGKLMVKGSMEWCCLDIDSHRIRKISSIKYPEVEMAEKTQLNIAFTNMREVVDKKNYIYTYTVHSTDIDVNFHTNNLKYNFMAMNAFSVEELSKFEVKEYEMYFVNESHEGDKIDIYKKKVKNFYYLEGRTGDKAVFRAVLKVKQKPNS